MACILLSKSPNRPLTATMPELVLVVHSGLRTIAETEALASLPNDLLASPRTLVKIDTGAFSDAVDAGDWTGQGDYLREKAAAIQQAADTQPDPQIHYFGLAEVPHVLALGAALGTERRLIVHEYDRDAKSWHWPAPGPSVKASVQGRPEGPIVRTRGHAVIRVAVSAEIHDSDVQAVVQDPLADVLVRIEGTPAVTRIRNPGDVLEVLKAFREAFAAVLEHRPGVETVHLFIAAPVSLCLAIGQELVPRNSPPVQTYRYRKSADGPSHQPAILIAGGEGAPGSLPLSEHEIAIAAKLRTDVWPRVLEGVRTFAKSLVDGRPSSQVTEPWYSYLVPALELSRAAPFPSLPALSQLVHDDDRVSPDTYHLDYGHDSTRHLWLLGDRLLVGLSRAGSDHIATMESFIRLFFFHEYVHVHHSLTKYTAANVGKFPNALERLDYTADTYAIFHELTHRLTGEGGAEPRRTLGAVRDQVDRVLRSFWAFEGPPPHNEMQTRRLRRYLNWYWRHAQLERADNLMDAVLLFTRSPAVELAGLRIRTDGERRVFSRFSQSPGQRLELAVLTEDDRLVRINDADATPMKDLLAAFASADHGAIQQWFRPVVELVRSQGAVFPKPHPLLVAPAADDSPLTTPS